MSDPLVSVVMPVYNLERYLGEAIDSVLGQTIEDLELIVVDDGSSDASAAVASSYGERLRYHYRPNGGIGAARNSGVSLARGSMLAFLDADDIWMPGKLELQLAAMREDPGIDMVFGMVQQFTSPELFKSHKGGPDLPAPPQAGRYASAMLVRRNAFLRVGSFDTGLRAAEFIDWMDRARGLGLRSVMLEEVVTLRRLHTTNTGQRDPGSRQDFARMAKAALDRRRGGGPGRGQS